MSVLESINIYKTIRDTVKIIAQDIATLENIPKNIRKGHIEVIDETMTLLCTTLEMVMTRLQDLLILARSPEDTDRANFITELQNLDYWPEWERVERDFRLCSNLRLRAREMEGIFGNIGARIGLRDFDSFKDAISRIIWTEAELAGFIGESLREVAELGAHADQSDETFENAKEEVKKARDAFRNERMKLIETQIEIMRLI